MPMYILRRRSDGLFYKNQGRRYWSSPKEFSEHLRDCKPFMSAGGARNCVLRNAIPRHYLQKSDRGNFLEGTRDWREMSSAQQNEIMHCYFEERYELVEVEVIIKS